MCFSNTTLFPLLLTLTVSFAAAQDAPAPDRLKVGMKALSTDYAKIQVEKTDAELGDAVIVVCGLDDADRAVEPIDARELKPLIVVAAKDPRLQRLSIEPADFAKLGIAIYAVALDPLGRPHFSPVKTAKQLVEDLESRKPEPGDVIEDELPELDVSVMSTDGIPPEFSLGIRTYVHPVGQRLDIDRVQRDADQPGRIDVYLTIADDGSAGGKGIESVGEELRAFVPLGHASGADVVVWLRWARGCVFGEYRTAAKVSLEK